MRASSAPLSQGCKSMPVGRFMRAAPPNKLVRDPAFVQISAAFVQPPRLNDLQSSSHELEPHLQLVRRYRDGNSLLAGTCTGRLQANQPTESERPDGRPDLRVGQRPEGLPDGEPRDAP